MEGKSIKQVAKGWRAMFRTWTTLKNKTLGKTKLADIRKKEIQ